MLAVYKKIKDNKKIMNINKKILAGVVSAIGVVTVAVVPFIVYAAPTADSQLTQEITAGVLSTDILDAGGDDVANPVFAMTSAAISNEQQTSTGSFGSNSQRITVDNPGGADGGWTLTLNADVPGTSEWTSGGDSYPYNDSAPNGRLTVNAAAGSLTSLIGASTSITLGGSTAFSGTNPVTLISAAAGSDDIWNGYVTGVGLTQTIPASQPAGSYTIDMVQTVAAI